MTPDTVESVTDRLLALPEGSRMQVGFPLRLSSKVTHAVVVENLRAQGFLRVVADGRTLHVDDFAAEKLDLTKVGELVVVVDSFLTDTAARATVVLPTTTLLEADDLLGSYGHHYLGVARPVVAPPPGVRPELEILQALAARLGLSHVLEGDARAWKRRLIEPKLGPHGVTLEALEAGPVLNPLPPKVLFADRRFPTPSGRVQLLTTPPAPTQIADGLVLMSLSTEKSQAAQWAVAPRAHLPCTVHPDVAAAAGVAAGEVATLISSIGRMDVQVVVDARQRRDVALVPKGGHLARGQCANALVAARTTDHGEGGALYDERVRLVPRGAA